MWPVLCLGRTGCDLNPQGYILIGLGIYLGGAVSKRLIDIDDDALKDAQQALGTSTYKETVNLALREAADAAARRRVDLEGLRRFAHAARDLRDSEVMAKAWE
jgi:Arc/MetJ family transcription regulator